MVACARLRARAPKRMHTHLPASALARARTHSHAHTLARLPCLTSGSRLSPRGNRAGFLTGTLLSLPKKGPLGATKDGAVCLAFTVAVDGFILPQLQAWWASSLGGSGSAAPELAVTALKRPAE